MSTARTLSPTEAQAFYDKFGEKQDKQGWYETPAIDALKAYGQFGSARSVFELGCGTGKLAAELFDEQLSSDAHYTGVDISPVMVELAQSRLAAFNARAKVTQTNGNPEIAERDGSHDRFLACYVFDLLGAEDIDLMLAEVYRILAPGGLFCVANLTQGQTFFPRMVSNIWSGLHTLSPKLVGGCRPIAMSARLSPELWTMVHRSVVAPFGLSSEAIVAERI